MNKWIQKASYLHILLIFISAGFILYGASLFNGFVADDNVYIVGNPFIKSFNLPAFFLGSSYYSGDITQLAGIYYKPIFTLITSLLYNLSGGTPFLIHFVQLLIHCVNAFLLFILFLKFFPKTLSYILAFIFLIHPGNVESVVYIADLQDVLFFLFGISALLLSMNQRMTVMKGFGIVFLLLCSLLSKETGVLFLPTAMLLIYFFNRKNFQFLAYLPPAVFVMYFFLRFAIAQVTINKHIIAPIMAASLSVQLMTLPKIIYSYIILLIFPLKLSWGQHWLVTTPNLQDFFIPLGVITASIIFLFILFKKTKHDKRRAFYFFLAMTILGLGLHAQFIPLDFTFAERWFYFPFVGLLGIIGVSIEAWRIKWKNEHIITIVIILILVSLFTRSFIRSLDWKDDYTLSSHDIKVYPESFALANNLGYELMRRGEYKEAEKHLEKSISLYTDQTALNNLAFTYAKLGKNEQSLSTYKRALQNGNFYLTTQNYIAELIRQKKYTDAKKEIQKALKQYPNNPKLWLLLSALNYNMSNVEEAISAAQYANQLSPGIGNFLLLKIQNKESINL